MHLIQNARALATGATRNLNTNIIDHNRYTVAMEHSVALARTIKAMADRGELEIARQMVAEYKQARKDAENLARLIGVTE